MLKLLQILVFITAAIAAVVSECPPNERISPCKCYLDYMDTVYECPNVANMTAFRRRFSELISRPIRLHLVNLQYSTIPDNFIHGLNLRGIVIINSTVREVSAGAFQGFENSLVTVRFEGTLLKNIPTAALSKLAALDSLMITNSRLTVVKKSEIDALPTSIKDLFLAKNNIELIEEYAFKNLSSMRMLLLHNNKLSKLPNQLFPSSLSFLSAR